MSDTDTTGGGYRVAVVIPTYNCALTLGEAIESVLAQTFRDFRLFVIDDGSTDATAEVLRIYSDRCVCLVQSNGGVSNARNRGIRESVGQYVAFLDADDLWHPTRLEREVSLLDEHADVGLVCSDFTMMGRDSQVNSYFDQIGEFADGMLFERLLQDGIVATPTVLARRQAIEEAGMFNESLNVCEDMNLWLKIASRWKIAAVREVLVTVRKRPGSLSAISGGTITSLKAGLASLQDVESYCKGLSLGEKRALRRSLSIYYYKSGSARLTDGAARTARAHLALALLCRPFHPLAATKFVASFLPDSAFRFLARLYRVIVPPEM